MMQRASYSFNGLVTWSILMTKVVGMTDCAGIPAKVSLSALHTSAPPPNKIEEFVLIVRSGRFGIGSWGEQVVTSELDWIVSQTGRVPSTDRVVEGCSESTWLTTLVIICGYHGCLSDYILRQNIEVRSHQKAQPECLTSQHTDNQSNKQKQQETQSAPPPPLKKKT